MSIIFMLFMQTIVNNLISLILLIIKLLQLWKKETFLYLDGHTEYHEVDDNAVYHHVTDDNRLNYRVDVNATFEWHNNAWMQVADNA